MHLQKISEKVHPTHTLGLLFLIFAVLALSLPVSFVQECPVSACDSSENCSGCDYPREQSEPDHSCCPGGCTHCPLICCSGVLFCQASPDYQENNPMIGFLESIGLLQPPSFDPGEIFHPPRSC